MGMLDGRIALFTGGGRGSGRGICEVPARHRAGIVIADIDMDNAERTATGLRAGGARALVVHCDVTSPASAEAAVQTVVTHFGTLDILVNNAGVAGEHVGRAVTEEDWDRCYEVNLKGSYARVRAREVFLIAAHFSPYEQAPAAAVDPTRGRKLLLNAHEIRKIEKATADEGTTLVPLRLYAKGGRIKVELALGRGKKGPDKRDAIRERDVKREMDRDRGARRVR